MNKGQKAATYTLCGGDVHVAADEGQTVVHAHLEINHPETKQHTHAGQVSSVSSCWDVTSRSTTSMFISSEAFPPSSSSLFDQNDVI